MPDLVGAVNETGSFLEEWVDSDGDDDSFDFSLFADRAKEDFVIGVLDDGEEFSGEGRLLNHRRITLKETSISWDDVTQLDADDVTRD